MTLAELLTTLADRGTLTASRVKDLKTSIKYLATALGHASPDQCPLDVAWREEGTWLTKLDDHFTTLTAQGTTVSAHTRRNTRNNVRVLMRTAAAHGLLAAPLPTRLLAKPQRRTFEREKGATTPYQSTYRLTTGPRHYGLRYDAWPPDCQAGWQTYLAACGLRLRAWTIRSYRRVLATYFGYVAHIGGRVPAWDDLFDVTQVAAFVRWHAERLQRPITVEARNVVIVITAMANVLKHPHAQALAAFRQTLPTPTPMHTKRMHWVSLAQIEAVADALLAEGRRPFVTNVSNQHHGARRATQFQRGLMLKVLVRAPLRQRNLREARLEHNLYTDQQGHWHLHFRGDELKVGLRQGRVNELHIDLSEHYPALIPALEEFLQTYRPLLPGAATSPLLFLTMFGTPFTVSALGKELALAVAMRTGQRFYPHLIRTIWATEYLEANPGGYDVAATMLGDTVQTVIQRYKALLDTDLHKKAGDFLAKALRTG